MEPRPRQCQLEPLIDGAIQHKLRFLDLFCDLPDGNERERKVVLGLAAFDRPPCDCRQTSVLGNPPDPGVRIKKRRHPTARWCQTGRPPPSGRSPPAHAGQPLVRTAPAWPP